MKWILAIAILFLCGCYDGKTPNHMQFLHGEWGICYDSVCPDAYIVPCSAPQSELGRAWCNEVSK